MLFWISICVVIAAMCYFMYKKINQKIGDSPQDALTPEEKEIAKVNDNKAVPEDIKISNHTDINKDHFEGR